MPEPDSTRDELRARLWRLPRQLLLALINGTAILVIVAAILACGKCWLIKNMVMERAAAIAGGLLRSGKGLGGPGEKVHALFATPISAMFAYSKGSRRLWSSFT